jgi:hypothetical protein
MLPIAAIAGGATGGVVILTFIISAIVFCVRKRMGERNSAARQQQEPQLQQHTSQRVCLCVDICSLTCSRDSKRCTQYIRVRQPVGSSSAAIASVR